MNGDGTVGNASRRLNQLNRAAQHYHVQGGNIDAVAVDVSPVLDDVAEIDPHAEFDALFGRNRGVSRRHRPLHLDRAAQLDEQTVTRRLNDAASMLLTLGSPARA